MSEVRFLKCTSGGMSKGRLEAFSDGVIAIIIMVLELKVPHGEDLSALRLGGCPKVCVNGPKAGNCRPSKRTENDCTESCTC